MPSLSEKYPPSEACSCEICRGYCQRPGWWTVEEAARAINAGYAPRMMLEMAPDRSFGVLSPAFRGCVAPLDTPVVSSTLSPRGCEGLFAQNEYAKNGCTFLKDGLCELHSSGHMPLECRFCHHSRQGKGADCHRDIGRLWNTNMARMLIEKWIALTGFKDAGIYYQLIRK